MNDPFAEHIRQIAANFPYPEPQPRPQSRRHRLRLVGALVLLALVAAVPVVLIQIGVVQVRIAPVESAATWQSLTLADVAGATTLFQAVEAAVFPVKRPAALPMPDQVFMQPDDTVILAWVDADNAPQMVLYQLAGEYLFVLKQVSAATPVSVSHAPGLWVAVPHPVTFYRDGATTTAETYLVRGNVLIWFAAGVTYRLETTLTLTEAEAIAESLVPVQSGTLTPPPG
jgi:hypothetical protein